MRIIKIIFLVIYLLLLFIHLVMLYFAQASIITTLLFYITIGLAGWLIIRHTFSEKNLEKYKNLSLLILTCVTTLFLAEVILKYGFKTNLTYYEKSGGFFYRSKYRGVLWETMVRKYWFHQKDLQLFVYSPNSVRFFDKPEFRFESRYNSMGLRGPEPDTSSSLVNIVGLGDSFMEGFGVVEDSTWFNLFIKQLSITDTSRKYQGINGGFSGSDVFYEYTVFKKMLLKYKPAYVILDVNTSDIDDVLMRGGFERYQKDGSVKYKTAPWWEYFYSFSIIFRDIIHAMYDIHWNLLTEEQNKTEVKKAEELICDCITNEYKELAEKNNFKLIVTFHPRINELQSNIIAFAGCKEKLKKENTIQFIDMQEHFQNKIYSEKLDVTKLYYTMDLHHTVYGNRIWARVFSTEFEKLNP